MAFSNLCENGAHRVFFDIFRPPVSQFREGGQSLGFGLTFLESIWSHFRDSCLLFSDKWFSLDPHLRVEIGRK